MVASNVPKSSRQRRKTNQKTGTLPEAETASMTVSEGTMTSTTEVQNGTTEVHGEIVEPASEAPVSSLAIHSKPGSAIAKASQSHLVPLPQNRPIAPSQFHYLEHSTLPGGRPIAVRSFDVAALLPDGSPIAATTLHVVGLLPGGRPVVETGFQYVNSDGLPSNRPIAVGTIDVDPNNMLPGQRPIASNADRQIPTLIGYLD